MSSDNAKLLAIVSKQTVLTITGSPEPATILIDRRTGKFASVRKGKLQTKKDLEAELGTEIDWTLVRDGSVLLPGLIDPHVHDNEPGRTAWEGFHTATAAAVSGGVTCYLSMPLNNNPVTTTLDALDTKLKAARFGLEGRLPEGYEASGSGRLIDELGPANGGSPQGGVWCDIGFWGGIIPGQENLDNLRAMLDAGVRGFKCFTCYSGLPEFPAVTADDVRKAMVVLKNTGSQIIFHAEIESCNHHFERESTYSSFLKSRPQSFEMDAISMIIGLLREQSDDPTVHTPTRMHIVHLSASTAVPMIRQARAEGLPLTIETTFHYLTISSEEVPETPQPSTQYKCVPPLRSRENQEALWAALEEGVIDEIVTDHSPCVPELKHGDFFTAWGGLSMLGCGISVLWTRIQERNIRKAKGELPGPPITIVDVARWCSTTPAKLVDLQDRKGCIAEGMDADLAVFDPSHEWTLGPEHLNFRHKVSPLIGRKLRGSVLQTYVRGHLVYDSARGCVGPKLGDLI